MTRSKKRKTAFTPDEIKFMEETYGRVLTPAEWEERQERFVSGPENMRYTTKGILRV